MTVRGIRGAVTVEHDDPDEIFPAVQRLLGEILNANPTLSPADIASAYFTSTGDLTSANPAQAARALGWNQVPLLCALEMPVAGSLPRCIRVLMHWNTDLPQSAVHHVYLGEAAQLRPDLAAFAPSAPSGQPL